jgi:hypothetical protein
MRIDATISQAREAYSKTPAPFREQAPWSTSRVSRVLFRASVALDAAAIIPLGRPLPTVSSSLPAGSGESPFPALPKEHWAPAYAALLPMGFAVPPALPRARWALTPPFHPYLPKAGGLFSVALSSAFPPPGVTRHRTLWSSDFPPASALARLRPAIACAASTLGRVASRRQCAWMKFTILGTTSLSRP